MAEIHLVRDVLDEQIFDRHNRRCGKVDGVIIQLARGAPPRVTAIEIGGAAPARRLWKPIARILLRAVRRWGLPEPYRIPWNHVHETGLKVVVDLDGERTPITRWEHAIREHVIRRIPGA